MTDSSGDTPSDRVKKAMAGKKPVSDAPFTVIEGGKARPKPRRPRAKKPAAPPEPPPHDEPPDGPQDPDEILPPGLPPADLEKAEICAGWDQNDRDNGRRLILWCGDGLLYVTGLGWLVWRGTHWQRDEADLDVRLMAQNLVDKIKLEAALLKASPAQQRLLDAAAAVERKPEADRTDADNKLADRAGKILNALNKQRSSRHSFAVSSGNSGRTDSMLKQAQSLKALPIDKLDADHMKFNVRNGTLHFWRELDPERPEGSERKVGRFAFEPHERGDYITKLAEVDYDPEAKCTFFEEQFLTKVHPDARMRLFLQVSTAYALLMGGNDEQRLFYHYGTGANGKSAFFELVGRIAGSYRQIASPETVTGDSQRAGQQANPDIARLHNARLVTIEELPKNVPLREELIKALTGGTKILARFLNKDFFEFMPIFTPLLNGNSKPAISGADYGIWRRVLLILWGVTIPKVEQMPPSELAERLDAERAGVLNWLIEGLLLYLGQGLEAFIPREVTEFTQDYREERDNVGVFCEVGIEHVPGHTEKAGVIYKAYTEWCEVNAMRPASLRSFGDSLTEKGFKKKRGNYILYLDVRLRQTASKYDGVPASRDPL